MALSLITGTQQWEATRSGAGGNARLQTPKGTTNPLVPFVIYPQGPETKEEDGDKEEKTIRKTNVARYQALPRVGISKLLLIANLAAAGIFLA